MHYPDSHKANIGRKYRGFLAEGNIGGCFGKEATNAGTSITYPLFTRGYSVFSVALSLIFALRPWK